MKSNLALITAMTVTGLFGTIFEFGVFNTCPVDVIIKIFPSYHILIGSVENDYDVQIFSCHYADPSNMILRGFYISHLFHPYEPCKDQ